MSRRPRPVAPRFAGRPYIDPGTFGPLPEPDRPMFVFDRELGTLERAFYRHLLRAIDLDALFELEQLLWNRLQALELFTDDQVLDLSNALIARTLDRVAHEPLRSMRPGTAGPDGAVVEVPEEPHGDCPFCGPWERGGQPRRGPGPGPDPGPAPSQEVAQ